jgi:hypothetical protein
MDRKQSFGQRFEAYQPSKTLWGWSCIACVAGTIAVGFIWGGWVTGGSARKMAAAAADGAGSEMVAALCVDRFKAATDSTEQLDALKKLSSWSRRDFIEKGGWTTMPGKPGAMTQAATLCADQLLAAGVMPATTTAAQ